MFVTTTNLTDRAGPTLVQQFHEVRRFTESLCEPLSTEDYVIQSMPDVSPTKWHLAHTTWFFERFILAQHVPDYTPHHPRFNYLFNSYYNTVGPQNCRTKRGLLSRPTVREVYDYRAAIDRDITRLLEGADARLLEDLRPLIVLGCHHEQQHQELMLTDIKHVLSTNPLLPAYQDTEPDVEAQHDEAPDQAEWITFDGAVREIGCNAQDTAFCFDNETPRHRVFLEPFALASQPVTNGDYLRFVEAGGYDKPDHWLSAGWATVQERGWRHPLYWYRDEREQWMQFTLHGPRPLAMVEPVCHLSYFEADAFARWCDARLPTEAQWEVAAGDMPIIGNFADDRRFHPRAAPAEGDHQQLVQYFGDVWEWTSSAYMAYPGYRPLPGALGEYNGKFMCNQYVLRGGSCATPRSHLRVTYRNFFPPDARWQFTGLRLAKDA